MPREKTYNDTLNEKGTADYFMSRQKNSKTGLIVKGLIFIPAEAVSQLNEKKGWALPVVNQKLLLRGGEPSMSLLMAGSDYTGEVLCSDWAGLSTRGKRLNEKIKEGCIDFLKVYGKKDEAELSFIVRADIYKPAPDAYKSSSEYTIEDLLDL